MSGVARTVPEAVPVPRAGLFDTLAVLGEVFLPTLAKGVIMRRPKVLALAELLDLDRRAIRRMQRLRDKYAGAPLLLPIPGRSVVLLLDPDDVHRVLAETPDPFTPASKEKRAALSHFEPRNVLLSEGPERAVRRRYNEQVLDTHSPVHHLAGSFLNVVADEAGHLEAALRTSPQLTWDDFAPAWFRIVRRVIFGDAAREDDELSIAMAKLRSAANWAFLRPQRTGLRERLFERIRGYLERAEPGSLAAVMAHAPASRRSAPEQQVPQWLFAFDPAGMATFRALALLATHPDWARRARRDVGNQEMPHLRATVLESLRLWPTTPLLLRESLAETGWEEGTIPARSAVVIYTPFFHRDSERFAWADRFEPELWQGSGRQQGAALVPFSEGPGVCPGRNLVLLLSTAMLAQMLERWRVRLQAPAALRAGQALPATLNHFGLRFEVRRK